MASTFARFAAVLLVAAPLAAGELRVGAAAVKITPPQGMPMAGYYYNRAAAGVHDDLHAKALVFEQDGAKAALVACDLASVPRSVVEEARRIIETSTGIAAGRVMISATHTHTGPSFPGRTSRDDKVAATLGIAQQYVADLPLKIADSVRRADAALAPARISAAVGREESLAFNRRYFMKDGSVGWNPGKLNPNIVKPAGPIDPAVPVVYIDTPEGKPLATYVNYAMHLDTVGGEQFSADYPYTLATLLGKLKSPEMLTVFTMGTSGNVNHLNVKTRDRQKGHEEAARIGTVLAGEVLKTYTRLEPLATAAPAARSEIVKLPLAAFQPGDMEKARALASKFGEPNAAPFMDLVWAFKVQDVARREGQPIEAEVQAIALGNQLAWVGLAGEIFVELGQAIKQASPFPYTVVASLSNGSVGYVPNRKAYPEGAYEVVSARGAAGSGEMLVDAALRLLKELQPK
ncbi:MAG: neutral/alkaline non-lysosomal ceramidase N-terminal domain-containing protein [Acidobacteriota bacterium]